MSKKIYGLIGRNIAYSFSQKYFEQKFQKLFLKECQYHIFDIEEISEVDRVFQREGLAGFNVTIPYKVQIMDYLDLVNEEAEAVGAVNTVALKRDKRIGYNTDVFGFSRTLDVHLKPSHKSAVILGDGGAAKAVRYVLEQRNIPYLVVSRGGDFRFEDLTKEEVAMHSLIIQCTPVGTFPKVDDCLDFPFEGLSDKHLVVDLVYNPEQTAFMKKSIKQNAKMVNGFFMLEQQAEKSWQIWNDE
ncbi:shikimate dehydrogenase family protein [Riemerella columbipharyngis]|uniref:Shikimate dehydrogenase n=1 Tax=Riemerella columbipharyngis TaxID=1071918 RepID=A0A1G7ATD3_9FLAO|nr:shikimate dehydrogenase [Riemerella columbipharyngis]SDE18041.1 shikimate dehydrogenase [Riemerella columbipharyngis]